MLYIFSKSKDIFNIEDDNTMEYTKILNYVFKLI